MINRKLGSRFGPKAIGIASVSVTVTYFAVRISGAEKAYRSSRSNLSTIDRSVQKYIENKQMPTVFGAMMIAAMRAGEYNRMEKNRPWALFSRIKECCRSK
jgi:hypothetical protein